MMYKTKTNIKWKYLIAIPVLVFVLLFANACSIPNKSKENVQVQNKEIILQKADEMPRFPGCETEATLDEKQKCAVIKMYIYIYSHLVYPSKAQENNIQGRVVARFAIDSKGNIKNIKILRDIGGGCGYEVKKVLNSMSHLSEKWIPGKQNGKNVSVYYTIPVNFKLSK